MTRWYQTGQFYDTVAQRLDSYTSAQRASFRARPEGENPEDRFTALVVESLAPDDIALDLGTGDGTWLLENVAPRVARAIGLDNAGRRFLTALQAREHLSVANCCFVLGDAELLPLADESVTVLINRRGPLTMSDSSFNEACRALAPGGVMMEIGIGERNVQELDTVFGERSQMHKALSRGSEMDRLASLHRAHGIEPITREDIVTGEYFPNREALEYRFLTTPMISDFDLSLDAARVEQVIAENQTPNGIRLTVHRPILFARKRE